MISVFVYLMWLELNLGGFPESWENGENEFGQGNVGEFLYLEKSGKNNGNYFSQST